MRHLYARGPCLAARIGPVLLTLFGAATTAAAQTSTPATPDSAYFHSYHVVPRDTVSPVVYDGFKQFALNCARCHGDFGVGTSFAPALVESVRPSGTIPTEELFIQTVCAGRTEKGMPGWCALGLDISKIQTMHAYLIERSNGKVGLGRPAVRE